MSFDKAVTSAIIEAVTAADVRPVAAAELLAERLAIGNSELAAVSVTISATIDASILTT